jgi:hypothetical protein
VEWAWNQGSGAGRFVRATVFGTIAAALGAALYYGVATITGYQIGLISIVVGFMVGAAVRVGCQGRGGWLYQALAMFLTYSSIVSTYAPDIMEGVPAPPSFVQQVLVLGLLIGILYAAPFLALAGGAGNVMGLVIIGIGVWQAWNMNKKEGLAVSGPYSLRAQASPPTPAG